jgi:hypothetical protein
MSGTGSAKLEAAEFHPHLVDGVEPTRARPSDVAGIPIKLGEEGLR